jgi:hypothetical protein
MSVWTKKTVDKASVTTKHPGKNVHQDKTIRGPPCTCIAPTYAGTWSTPRIPSAGWCAPCYCTRDQILQNKILLLHRTVCTVHTL